MAHCPPKYATVSLLGIVSPMFYITAELWYEGRNSTTAEEVSKFQHPLSCPHRVATCQEGHPVSKNLLQGLMVGDWSTNKWLS